MSAALRCFAGDIVVLEANVFQLPGGTRRPSLSDVTWDLSDRTVAELFEVAPNGSSAKVLILDIGNVTVTATTDLGDITYDITVADPTLVTEGGRVEHKVPLTPIRPLIA